MVRVFSAARHQSDDARSHLIAVGLVALVGLSLVAHPLYLFPHFGQVQYDIGDVEPETESTPAAETVIDYATLSPHAQNVFDAARRGEQRALWSGEDDDAIRALESHRYVRHQGTYYEYTLRHTDNPGLLEELIRGGLSALGAFLVVLSGLVLYAGTWRPLTPRRSLWLPIGVVGAIVAMQAYDVLYSGAGGSLPYPKDFRSILPLAALFLAAGSVWKQRGARAVLSLGGGGAVLLVFAQVVVLGAPLVVPLLYAGFSTIGGLPVLVVGYWLTAPE